MFKASLKLSLLTLIGLLAACHTKPSPQGLYYWGNYSDLVYQYYNEPGNLGEQENALRQIIAKSAELNKPVAPGVYGQLGLVLSKQGRIADAQALFKQESELYPESKAFIQFLQRKGAK